MFEVRTAGSRRVATKGYREYVELLESTGYDRLGAGCVATVLQKKGSSNVVKFFDDNAGTTGFVQFVQKRRKRGRNCDVLPKFVGRPVEHIGSTDKPFYALEMERLYSFPESYRGVSKYEFIYALDLFIGGSSTESRMMRTCKLTRRELREVRAMRKFYKRVKKDKSLPSICMDLHAGNVMIRDDGSFVITDPFV